MKNSNVNPCHILAPRYYIYIIALFLFSFSPQQVFSQCVTAKGTIDGIVFADANNNGLINPSDIGVANVLVQAYDQNGALVGSATTGQTGTFSFSNLTDGQMVKLIFNHSNSQSSSLMGADNGSSVQFVQVPACSVSFGLVSEENFCNEKTEIVTTCFVQGTTNTNKSEATIVGITYGFNSASPPRKLAGHGETGSIWGLAWKNSTKEIFSASFVKQYAGLTPSGHDAIFRTIPSGNGFSTSLYTKLSTLGQPVGTLSVTDVADCAYGAQVGKMGLGAMITSPDEKYLYVVNLFNNTLVKLPTVTPTSANTVSYQIPDPGCANGEYRAFALKYHGGKIYVGVTCTAETAKSAASSSANVYEFEPTTGGFKLVFTTNYIKGYWYDYPSDGLGHSHWLTDIDFTDDGNMLLSLSDRLGHRYCKTSTNRLDEQKPDLLMVWNNNGTWQLENNGKAGTLSGTGIGNGQGPGGGEFFGYDHWITDPLYHSETAIGSIFVMPGTNSVVAAVFDPEVNAYSGGLHRYNTQTGAKDGSKELYTRDINIAFGKATGFGEIIATCGLPEIEIGNLVWNDANGNGIQDANEKGFGGITINLLDENCGVLASTVTDVNGNYVFNNKNVTEGLQRNRNYFITIDATHYSANANSYIIDGAYYTLTPKVSGFVAVDSDAALNTQICNNGLINVQVNNTQHTFDIGLLPSGQCRVKIENTVVNNNGIKVNDDILFEISLLNQGSTIISGADIQAKLPKGFIFIPELNSDWTLENGLLTASIDATLSPNERGSILLSLQFDQSEKNRVFRLETKILSITDALGNISTDIRGCLNTLEDGEAIAIPNICDLALLHRVDTEKIYTSNSDIMFVTTICNQGTADAMGFDVTNYINNEFEFNPALNIGWNISQDLTKVSYTENQVLSQGECRDVKLIYQVKKDAVISQVTNYAEISSSSCDGLASGYDFDSTPDTDVTNDKGGHPNTGTDNNVDDNGDLDEDDHDPAVVNFDLVDLSLTKVTKQRRVKPGDLVIFDLIVRNEGGLAASKVSLVDYLPEGTTLADDSWTQNGLYAEKEITFSGNLQPGQSFTTQITIKINDDIKLPSAIMNMAEITSVFDHLGRDISSFDVDSNPDFNSNNDKEPLLSSIVEDDFSQDQVAVLVPNEYVPCFSCRVGTTPDNGQFEMRLSIVSLSGEEWFVESSLGLFDETSGLPPAAPIVLPDGYLLEELPHTTPGFSIYVLNAIHLDGEGYSVRLRNKFGDLEQLTAPSGVCNLNAISIDGPLSLCSNTLASYEASATGAVGPYIWLVDGDTLAGTTANQISIDWSTYGDGEHIVHAALASGCFAPAEITVALGVADFSAIACLGSTNVSLDGDCEIVVTPSMLVAGLLPSSSPYVVMLTDVHGNVIPNATLTNDHVGTTVMAKLIEGCGGNSCWSSIKVEDKYAPVSICRDIILPCYKVDEYEGPFERDNCDGDVTNIIVSETATPLTCNVDFVKYIDRVYQATDKWGNKSELCTMRISVERPDLDLLRFPNSLTMVNDSVLICDSYEKDEFGRPSVEVAGVPTLAGIPLYPTFAPICNLYAGYTDVEFSNIGCTKKIMRNWTVYEQWCSDGELRSFVQVIEITDTISPVIEPIEDFTVSTASYNACEANVTLPLAVVTDSCTNVLEVDVTYPGGFVQNQTSPAFVTLPVGDNVITYTAYDECKNSSQITFVITVEDKTAPTVICKGEIVVGLNSNGEAYLYPQNVNDGSYDGCGIDSMRIAKMVPSGLIPDKNFLPSIDFSCADAGDTIMVALRVWDTNGNSNSCMVSVEIQDKHAPKITCPADVTVDCTEIFTGVDLTQYGTATAIDACGATVTELAPLYVLNSCRVGYIQRTFVASDVTSSVTCTQIITVENTDFFNPLTDVVKPLDFEVSDRCSVDELLPENLDPPYDYPVITQSACGMAAATYSDQTFTFVTGACYKILRTWTVIDWCEMERLGQSYVPYTFQQVIKVNNTVPPFFVGTVVPIDTFLTEEGNCVDGIVNLSVTGRDLCTPDNKLRWAYKVDLFNDGSIQFTNTGLGHIASIVNATYPVGLHKVTWSFEDACGNVVAIDQLVLVRNNDKPQAVCLDAISVAINPWDLDGDGEADIEKACVVASSLNASSSSLCCTDPLRYSFSADVNDTLRCFDCFDVGLVNVVELWVHDCNGRTDFCEVVVEVQDNNDSDICELICVENAPTPAITGDTIICRGDSTILTATGGTSYVWNTGDTRAAITVKPIVNTTYTVTVTNEIGCTASASITVTVNPLPNAQIEGNNICNGGSTTLTASGGGTYLWSTGAVTSQITVSPTTNTGYTVTVTSAQGCTSTAFRLVTVSPLPQITVSGTNVICRNQSTTLTASGNFSYLWSNGATTSSITVSPLVTTTYTVTATDVNGCSATASRQVTVNQLPNVGITGDNKICIGTNTLLTASGGTTYLWNTGQTTTSITVNPVVNTTYIVTATDGNGCQGTASIPVTVDPLPTIQVVGDNIICRGESTTLTASGAVSYVWSPGNQTTASITVSPQVTTTYTVTGTDANGCINTGTRTVTVNPLPTVSIAGTPTVCEGGSTLLTASGGVTYLWNTGQTTAAITAVPLANTTYRVTATDNNGCTATASVLVTVNPNPIAVITGDLTICAGESTILTASGGGNYLWSTNATTAAITVSPLADQIYTVTVTSTNGCTDSASATVTVDTDTLVCTTQDITVFLGPNGSVSIDPEDISTGTNGSCTNLVAEVTPAEFFCNDVGVIEVTLTVINTNTNDTLTCTADVTVVDTIPPTLSCPQNVTVNCSTFDIDSLQADYGVAIGLDNCPNNLQISELVIANINDCNVGQITRTFTATDNSGNSVQCVQLITIENNNPVTLADITFPADTTVFVCSGISVDISGMVDVNTSDADCSNIFISFTDDHAVPDTICLDTVIRTWTVIDSCQLVPGTNSGIFIGIQNIFVGAEQPIILGPLDTVIYVQPGSCTAFLPNGLHTAQGCDLALDNDYNNNGTLNIRDEYPVGITEIVFTAFQACNNSFDTLVFTIEVLDTLDVSFNCVKTFPPINDDLEAIDVSFAHYTVIGNCDGALEITSSFSPLDIFDTIRVYNCSQVFLDLPTTIYFWVEGVVFDSCTTLITPVDPDDLCPNNLVNLVGSVKTEAQENVPGVKVALMGSNMPANISNQNGLYSFPDMLPGGEYDVVPKKNINPTEGVSTLDLVYIQRHILRTEVLNSPYKIIAADINKDDKVTAADIVQLRKLILGIYNQFPSNESWRMVDKGFVFPDPKDPFLTPFTEQYHIDNLNRTMAVNWIGVKIGDVNASYKAQFADNDVTSRTNGFALNVEDVYTVNGDNIIPVTASQAEFLTGFQIAIKVDNASDVVLRDGVLGIEDYHYNFVNGYVVISWSDQNGISVQQGDKLFDLVLRANTASTVARHLSKDIAVINAEYYNNSLETRSLGLQFIRNTSEVFEVYGNTPNPWNNETSINFNIPQSGEVTLHVRDITGRMVHTSTNHFVKGHQSIKLQNEQLGVSGILIYDLIFDNEVKTMKMLNIK